MRPTEAPTPTPGRWGAVPVIRPGDSLSGIVARAAGLSGMTPAALLADVGYPTAGQGASFKSQDLNPLAHPIRHALAAGLGVDPAMLDAATLVGLHPLVGPGGHAPGALTAQRATWVRLSASPGCVPCLQERPAHQLLWRVALLPVCTRHHLVLADRCPLCGNAPFGRPSTAVPPGAAPHCQHCTAAPELLIAGQRPATGQETEAARAVRALISAAQPEQLAHARLLRALVRLLRSIPAVLDHLAVDLPEAVTRERAYSSAGQGRRRAQAPPNTSLLTALLPVAAAVADDPDRMSAGAMAAIRTCPPQVILQAAVRGDRQLHQAAELMSRLAPPRRRRVPQPRRAYPVVGGLHTDIGAAHIDLASLPLLCPTTAYNRWFADLLYDAAAATGQDGLTFGQGRRAVPVAAAVLLTGWTAHGAGREIGAPGAAAHRVRGLLTGLRCTGRTADLETSLRTYLDWLASPQAPDYRRRTQELRADPAPLVAALTHQGIDQARALRWLIEEWACDLPTRHGLHTVGPRVEAADLPEGIEALLDGLIVGDEVALPA